MHVRLRWEQRVTKLNSIIGPLEAERPFAPELLRLRAKRAYAVARVARLSADIAPRLDWCGTETLPVACKCGPVNAKKTCRQWWLCEECAKRRAPAMERDIRQSLKRALAFETEAWALDEHPGQKPAIYLLTLTQRHTGNLSTDRDAIARGWRALYKRMHDDYGAFPYVGVWEVTRGDDGLGHVHLHIAVIWRYRDWSRVRGQWLAACPSSSRLDISDGRKDGKESTPSSVAKYLGKYLSKGCDLDAFTPTLRAEVSAAFYNQRSVIASTRFFVRFEKCCAKCGERFALVVPEPKPFEPRSETLHWYFHGLEPPLACGSPDS